MTITLARGRRLEAKPILVAAWTKVVALINTPPLPDQDDTTDELQLNAPAITDAEGDAFFVAVAQVYQNLGIISQNTYIALRSEINQVGENASNALFDVIVDKVISLTEARPVLISLLTKSLEDRRDQIPTEITTVETDRDLRTDQVLINALNAGICRLHEEREALIRRVGE